MLRITQSKSALGAKKYYTEEYYREGVQKGDYYSEKDQVIGNWGGKACEELGLKGVIRKEDFGALCDNLHPVTGDRLTERQNIERRVGYDFTFNASKSVSLAYVFGDETRKKEIMDAFRNSVSETMQEIEKGMLTRVRGNGLNENRETGNIAYGEFIHFTSRPVDGIADPHLHSHCFVLNATHDPVENKWKAGEFGQIKKDAPYYEAVFHSLFAEKLQGLGYDIEKQKTGFELKGISRELIEKFSRRTEEIEKLAAEKEITDNSRKSELGARTRESKRVDISPEHEKAAWVSRLDAVELEQLYNLKKPLAANDNRKENIAVDAVENSLSHHLERKSVATDKEILTSAIKNSLGNASWGEVKKAFEGNEAVISVKEREVTYITTKEALNEENALIAKAYDFKGRFKPILESYKPETEKLTDEQRTAIKQALSTTDGITIIAGKAGTGKTTLMKEVQSGIRYSGKEIFAFAPSAEASRGVQRKEGFKNAETIAALLQTKELQDKVKGQVIWIDEAGMVSNRDMNKILDVAKEQKARVILTGDTRQHNSVERGDALRTLQQEAGIAPVQVSKIQRQKNKDYKQAVGFLSTGNIEKGFAKLDKMGAVKEIESGKERIEKIADDYFQSAYKGNAKKKEPKEVLVISPTHAEGDIVTSKIRERLKSEGVIEDREKQYLTLKNTQLTEAQKQNPENYQKGNWVIFHQNIKGFKAGARYEVLDNKGCVKVKDAGSVFKDIPLDKAKYFHVYEPKQTAIAKGDKIRITGNGKTEDGKHLFNGTVFRAEGFDRAGNIKLSNGSTLSKDYGHFGLGYVMTSHSSQGKTVDKVIISQSSASFRASSMEQFYVSVSRGHESVAIYTDCKKDLLQAVSQSNERKSARELTNNRTAVVVDINRVRLMDRLREKASQAYDKVKQIKERVVNYELPGKTGRTK